MRRREHNGAGVSPEEFQKILAERIAERRDVRKEARQRDLKRIAEMRSRDGIDVLERFPKEIWCLILRELGPKDLRSFWETHELFRDLMRQTRIRDILFPQILGFEVDYFWKSGSHQRGCGCCGGYSQSITSPLARHILLRKVSRSMRDGVDRWFEDNLLKLMTDENIDNALRVPSASFTLFKDDEKLNQMLALYQEDPGAASAKRFFMRSIQISFLVRGCTESGQIFSEGLAQFKDKVKSLLDLIGSQVWRFAFLLPCMYDLSRNGVDISEIYLMLLEWANLMPNLKWLSLNLSLYRCRGSVRLPEVLRSNRFPRLEHLRRISLVVGGDYDEEALLFEAVILSNPHVKIVNFYIFVEPFIYNNAVVAAMSSLKLERVTMPPFRISRVNCLTNDWKLKQLKASLDFSQMPVHSLIQMLNNIPTLELLSLCANPIVIGGEISFLKLPNLKEFKFMLDAETQPGDDDCFSFSLQFLLYCKNLRMIHWEYWLLNVCYERKMKFLAGIRDLKPCNNVWDVFPYLERIYVQVCGEQIVPETIPCAL